jgi:hypothetical protein
MTELQVDSYRWVDDEPQPGIIEVSFLDASGVRHVVVDKHPIFSASSMNGRERPDDLSIRCRVIDELDPDTVRISFEWSVETTTGAQSVVVGRSQLRPDRDEQ